jgi:hypothetical protein
LSGAGASVKIGVGMRKAAAVVFVVTSILSGSAFPAGTGGLMGSRGTVAPSEAQETAGFTLAANAAKSVVRAGPARALPDLGLPVRVGPAASPVAPEIEVSFVKADSPALVTLSIFLGRGHGDPFSTLHERYAWRTNFKTGNRGAAFYKNITITKAIRIRPYVGVIKSSARLRPSYLYEGNPSYEYRLTAFCIGLPLVCSFN